jgi:membrane dipeptidase
MGIIMKFIDMHCDTISAIRESRNKGMEIGLHNENLSVTLNKLRYGNVMLQNFALFVDKEAEENPYQAALEMIKLFYEEMKEFQEYISQVTSYSQIAENRRCHKISALLTLEEGGICQGEIE